MIISLFWLGMVILCHLGFIGCVASMSSIGLGLASSLPPKWRRCNWVRFFPSTFVCVSVGIYTDFVGVLVY